MNPRAMPSRAHLARYMLGGQELSPADGVQLSPATVPRQEALTELTECVEHEVRRFSYTKNLCIEGLTSEIALRPLYIFRCINLGNRFQGVEHLLSALEMLGVDNARIEVEGSHELPIIDGSALGWTVDVQAVSNCLLPSISSPAHHAAERPHAAHRLMAQHSAGLSMSRRRAATARLSMLASTTVKRQQRVQQLRLMLRTGQIGDY